MLRPIRTLVDLTEVFAEEYASRVLFGTRGNGFWRWTTYAEFKREVAQFRAALVGIGVRPGDKIGIVANNRVEWAVACHAAYSLRAAFVPMYEQQHEGEWEFILADCGAKIAIGATPAIAATLSSFKPRISSLSHVIGLEGGGDATYRESLNRGAAAPRAAQTPDQRDTACLIYTSGTTGKPKGVILSHGNIASNINAAGQIFEHRYDDRSLAFLPWAHAYGQTCELNSLMHSGSSLALNDDIANLMANMVDVKPTLLFAVPRVFSRIYDTVTKQVSERPKPMQRFFQAAIRAGTRRGRGESLAAPEKLLLALADRLLFSKIRERFGGRLRFVSSGSAALAPEIAEFIDALGIKVYEGYGLTETSPIATTNYPGHRKIGSVGRPLPDVSIKIDFSVTDDPKNGEIVIYGPNVMQGYLNRPDENAAVLLPDGGFRSGDMGYLDEDGYLYVTGRIKEQYKLENGKYVVPSPLEEELKLSPFIANVMLHGANKPHNVAVIVPDRESLTKWASENGVELGDIRVNPKVHELLSVELKKYAKKFKGYERPEKFVIADEDFTADNGMLTPTLKLKRNKVLAKYGAALEALY